MMAMMETIWRLSLGLIMEECLLERGTGRTAVVLDGMKEENPS
jgi:hypothetical protein